ncbi:MAG: acyltransferase [Acidimicrobiales bacterium]|nr:acyltransferase [Acidimicrobiales bacterium]RZV46555.1 MAG: hypothetical protein EX269_06975 [Acidimicrobiales bacterium]
MSTTTATPTSPTLRELAAQAKPDRNRAVDFYRVVAMLAVAVGHWIAITASSADGQLSGGNALSEVAGLSWVTWILQVMPLFFVVGGFASAMSLDAHHRDGGRSQDWIAARLRRMLPPTVMLAAAWLVAIILGAAAGQAGLVIAGASAAAIPLWFLANYTIDTALAPFVFVRFRANPRRFGVGIVAVFVAIEIARLSGVPMIGQLNWVLGWLGFQVLGMAWRDGQLPSGRRLVAVAMTFWAAAVAAVSFGPYSVSMVHFPGIEHSPTHPPSLSLALFGLAYSFTAIAVAPRVSTFLVGSPKLWAAVVAGNGIAMSVYLWHMTAAIVVYSIAHLTVGLGDTVVGSADWWIAKAPMVLASALVLAPIVKWVSKVERDALLAPRRPWNGGVISVLAVAALTSAAFKAWTTGGPIFVVAGSATIVLLGMTVFRIDRPR